MSGIVRKALLPAVGRRNLAKCILLGGLSGFCNFLLINVVTRVISGITSGGYTQIDIGQVVVFAAIILIFVWTKRSLALAVIDISQNIFWRFRKQILKSVLHTTYDRLLNNKSEIHAAIISDVGILTQASMSIINFVTSAIIVTACFIYIVSISPLLFGITMLTAVAGVSIYWIGSRKIIIHLKIVRRLEEDFVENYQAIINGFKEIYMEPEKGRFLYDHKIEKISQEACRSIAIALNRLLNNSQVGQILYYILISSILLVFSVVLGLNVKSIVAFVFTLMYLFGSIETIMVLFPQMLRAKVAYNHLTGLNERLAEYQSEISVASTMRMSREEFSNITIRGLKFSYRSDRDAFGIGPADLDIQRGEIIFLYGGNGAGKTTFMNSIIGLYAPSAGEIRLNDVIVNTENYPIYRTLFSVVFSDFYLFKEIMEADKFDNDKFEVYLNLFELETTLKAGNRICDKDLSTGQRKRLALILALMEEKPILVMDEWAADQDPYFRNKFYTKLLPSIKEDGFTVIAITHDDKYYHCADKLYKMEAGQLVNQKTRSYLTQASTFD